MWILLGLLLLGIIWLAFRNLPKEDPLTPGELDIPKVEEGEELARLYGTHWIKDPQVHWWGDVDAVAIRDDGGKK